VSYDDWRADPEALEAVLPPRAELKVEIAPCVHGTPGQQRCFLCEPFKAHLFARPADYVDRRKARQRG
jgi:hypothetical protein